MKLFIINQQLNKEEIEKLSESYDHYIKFVVDVVQNIAAAGTVMHYECEQFLIENGSEQNNLWGGGIDLRTKIIDYTSLINIRGGVNPSMEVLNTNIRSQIDVIINKYFNTIF